MPVVALFACTEACDQPTTYRYGSEGRLAKPFSRKPETGLEPVTPCLQASAARFQVTAQTIRNWIDHGVLAAVRVGRGYRIAPSQLRHASASRLCASFNQWFRWT
jgi:excisionase family DNA binding protein